MAQEAKYKTEEHPVSVVGNMKFLGSTRSGRRMLFPKQPGLPPLTSNYRMLRVLRDLDALRLRLKNEIGKCGQDQNDRQKMLDKVLQQTENLKSIFGTLDKSYDRLEILKEEHQKVIESLQASIKNNENASRRYSRAGKDLSDIKDIVNTAIQQNQMYQNFMEDGNSSINSSGGMIRRFEKLYAIKNDLTQELDKVSSKIDKTKSLILQNTETSAQALKLQLEKLQTVDYKLNHIAANNATYELALNNIAVTSVDNCTTINRIIRSVESIIDGMIQRKEVGEDIKKKSLAKQFEEIRSNYLKKKAVLQDYNRSKIGIEKRKSRRIYFYEKYTKKHGTSDMIRKRLNEMIIKKKLTAAQKAQEKGEKMKMRLMGLTMFEGEQNKEFDPFAEPNALVNLHDQGIKAPAKKTVDDDDFATEDDDASAAVYDGDFFSSLPLIDLEGRDAFIDTWASRVTLNRTQISGRSSMRSIMNSDTLSTTSSILSSRSRFS